MAKYVPVSLFPGIKNIIHILVSYPAVYSSRHQVGPINALGAAFTFVAAVTVIVAVSFSLVILTSYLHQPTVSPTIILTDHSN